jgi:hypothetical protein
LRLLRLDGIIGRGCLGRRRGISGAGDAGERDRGFGDDEEDRQSLTSVSRPLRSIQRIPTTTAKRR